MNAYLKTQFLVAVSSVATAGFLHAGTVLVSDTYTVTGSGSGFALNTGVNTGINPPTTRLTGTMAANLRYINTGTKATSAYTIGSNKLKVAAVVNAGRFVLSANGTTAFDFGPALGVTGATPSNPVVYDLAVNMDNDATATDRISFALGTAEGDSTTWAFGVQLYRVASGNTFYTIGKRIDTTSSGLASDLNAAITTLGAGTYGTELTFLVRVTDAGSETSAFHSRVQVSLNGGSTWIYDTATDTDLTSGFRFNGAARIIMWDQAPSAIATYDNFSVTWNSGPHTWTGAGANGNWSTDANWGGPVPVSGDTLIFAGTTRQTSTNDLASLSVPWVTFNNGSFTLWGNSLTASVAITNASGVNTFKMPLAFGVAAPKTWSVASGTEVVLDNTTTVETNGDHTLVGGGTIRTKGTMNIGQATASIPAFILNEGKHIVDGGTFNSRGGYRIGSLATGAGAQTVLTNGATFNLTASTANLRVGDSTNPVAAQLTLNNSTLTMAGGVLCVPFVAGAIGSVNQVGGTVSGCVLSFSDSGAGTGTYTVTGGTLQPLQISEGTSTGTSTITFDNATLRPATGASSSFMSGLNTAQINAGGLTIDTPLDITVSQVMSGTGALNKTGTAALTLSGANTFSGGTVLTAGTLNLGNAAAAGTGTLTLNGGTITASGAARTLSNPVTVGGNFTVGGTNALTFSGSANLGSATWSISAANTATTTLSGIVSGTGGLTKDGSGTLQLSGSSANTYSGVTTVDSGTLLLAKSAGVNAIGGSLTVGDGTGGAGADIVRLSAADQIATTAVTVSASGLLDLNGFNETIGSLSASAGAQVGLGAGTLTVGDSTSTTYPGSISGTGSVVKAGSGTLTLTGASTFSGASTVSAGVLNIQNATALGGTGAVSVSSGAALELPSGITISGQSLTLNGSGISGNGALRNVSGNNTWTGAVTLGSASTVQSDSGTLTISGGVSGGQTLTVEGAGNTTVSGVISGAGALTKNDAGTVTLIGANTYSGNTTINAGTLNVGNAAAGTGTLTLNGGTITASGAAQTLSNPVTVGGNFTVGGTNALTLSGSANLGSATWSINAANAATTTLSGIVSGTGGLTKDGSGTLQLSGSGANTYSGATTVDSGTLLLAKTAGVNAIAGSLTVGDGTGGAGADIVRLSAADQIATTAVTVSASGLLDLNGFNETIGSLSGSAGAQVGLGAGTLTVGDSTSTTYPGSISGTGSVVKTGSGTLTLTSASTFSGAATVSAGVLNVQNATALGGTGAVSVSSGAALELVGGITVSGQPLMLNGSGISGNGALRNVSGNNTWAGAVTLGSASTVQSDSGTLTIGGGVSGGQTLTVEGAGNTTVSGVISGTGALTKNDAGTVTLSGANTYSGNTTINAGTVALGATGAIASPTITVASGATYNVSAVTGYTLGATQILARNATSGAGTVSGSMTLASGAKISLQADGSASSVGTLSVSGGLTLNNNTITINVTGAALGIGTYTLVTYSGARTGAFSNTPTITGSGVGSGLTATLVQGSGTISLQVAAPGHGIAAARIKVVENDLANNNTSVTVSTVVSVNGMSVRDGSSRGDYTIQIGSTETDDFTSGAVMTCVAENGRDNGEDSGINYCTSSISSSSGVSYFIPTSQAPTGAEYNINVAAAYFPYNRYLAGFAKNSAGTSGGPNDSLTGSPGLVLGTHFIDHGDGTSTVNLTSMGINSQTDGILLVTAAANNNEYAVTQANADGTWTILVKDNGTNGTATTQGPVSFAFVPLSNPSIITGKFHSDGTILMYNGASPRFNVVSNSTGTWTLTIPGYSPSTGVLVLSPETAGGANSDNVVSYQPSGSSWVITSRDLPGLGLQTPGDPVCSFVFVPAPTAALVAPANGSTISSAPTLTVTASNPGTGNVKVTFFGHRATILGPGPDFMIPVLPDTQNYAREDSSNGHATRQMWYAQTDWIVSHRDSDNIPFVATLGDCVQNGDTLSGNPNEGEWQIATNAYYRLEDQDNTKRLDGIPYLVSVGNHDQDPNGDPDGTTTLYNKYFGSSHFTGKSYYGGHYSTNNDTWYALYSAGNLDFLVISFEYGRYGQTVLDWAQGIIDLYPTRRILVLTHFAGDDTPDDTTSSPFSAQGQAIYTALKGNANFFMMLGGHVFNEGGEGRRSDTFNGHTVRTLISDYQGRFNGGNGLMRLMYFSPSNNIINIKTFSPYTGLFETDANSQFSYTYNMQPNGAGSPATAYVALGTNSNVTSGSQTSVVWNGLTASKPYEWYVTVTDQNGDYSTSVVWTFQTGVGFALHQVPPADANGDGLPDAWESKYNVTNPTADDDGDGQSNYAEYIAGTNPRDATSVLRIINTACNSEGQVTLTWSSVGGTQYRIQVADSATAGFTDIVRDAEAETDSAPAGQASTQTYTDTTSSPNAIRFYRVEVVH